jgi:hypothetical protein
MWTLSTHIFKQHDPPLSMQNATSQSNHPNLLGSPKTRRIPLKTTKSHFCGNNARKNLSKPTNLDRTVADLEDSSPQTAVRTAKTNLLKI